MAKIQPKPVQPNHGEINMEASQSSASLAPRLATPMRSTPTTSLFNRYREIFLECIKHVVNNSQLSEGPRDYQRFINKARSFYKECERLAASSGGSPDLLCLLHEQAAISQNNNFLQAVQELQRRESDIFRDPSTPISQDQNPYGFDPQLGLADAADVTAWINNSESNSPVDMTQSENAVVEDAESESSGNNQQVDNNITARIGKIALKYVANHRTIWLKANSTSPSYEEFEKISKADIEFQADIFLDAYLYHLGEITNKSWFEEIYGFSPDSYLDDVEKLELLRQSKVEVKIWNLRAILRGRINLEDIAPGHPKVIEFMNLKEKCDEVRGMLAKISGNNVEACRRFDEDGEVGGMVDEMEMVILNLFF